MTIERPILFSTEMVKAILAGRKTQTRRVVKPQTMFEGKDAIVRRFPHQQGCLYGHPGDMLWVRETFYAYGKYYYTGKLTDTGKQEVAFLDSTIEANGEYRYVATESVETAKDRFEWGWHKRPSIFMPRDACRVLLHVKNIRVEKLQDISTLDALAEGIETPTEGIWNSRDYSKPPPPPNMGKHTTLWCVQPKTSFRTLWNKINGKTYPWESNPWLWVIEFDPQLPGEL